LYIMLGVVISVAVLIAIAFSLIVLVPTLCQVTARVDDSLDSRVLNAVNFSKYATNETYAHFTFGFVFQLLHHSIQSASYV